MKKTIIMLAFAALLAGCDNAKTTSDYPNNSTTSSDVRAHTNHLGTTNTVAP